MNPLSLAPVESVAKAPTRRPTAALLSIDVLRGVSALGVVLFHSRVDLWIGLGTLRTNPAEFSAFDRWSGWLSAPFSQFGYLVMLFFVISGFCIHLPYAGRAEMPNWRVYGIRRFWRIVPPYLAAIILSFIVFFLLQEGSEAASAQGHVALWSALFGQNYIYGGGQMASNPSLWSIPVEVELYLAYVAIAMGVRVFRISSDTVFWVTGSASALALVLFALGWQLAEVNFLKFWVIWWSGAWLAEKWSLGTLPNWTGLGRWIAVGAFAVTAAMTVARMPSAYLHFGWGALSFCGLWWALAARWEPRGWGWRALGKLGLFSYSLYLIHFPLLQAMGAGWRTWFGEKAASIGVPIAGALLCIPAAWLFYLAVEQPCHALGRRLGQRAKATSVL